MAAPRWSDPFSVEGHNIVIVGGTAGIGLAVAEHLAAAGATVVITGRREGEAIAEGIGPASCPWTWPMPPR